MDRLTIIGGGLAGSEAAWQAAQRGIGVDLYEMRPYVETGAHVTDHLGELVCSNSLGSNLSDRASGLLKNELRKLNSLLIRCAEETSVPAGGALAVDRDEFAQLVTRRIIEHPNINVVRREIRDIPSSPTVIASGPLTSKYLSDAIAELTGHEHLFFFDAISPIVSLESIDMGIAFRASRYNKGEMETGDYINCPLNQDEYNSFVQELIDADRIELKSLDLELEKGVRTGIHRFFEGCLPIEIIAKRGQKSLAFGPLRPVGLINPHTGKRPYAVVQLRQDNLSGSLYNLVGFQTNLKFSEQRRVIRMIPGLEKVEFYRYGQMHRNTFIFSPKFLQATLQFVSRDDLFFAGQITGVEGYAGNIATGLLAGWNASRYMKREDLVRLPQSTMLGALCWYITQADPADFQPMKANFGILPPIENGVGRMNKRQRAVYRSRKALLDLDDYVGNLQIDKELQINLN
jgi:methylenetetrahydrofolate--tRNA-(uracil-5-)-methyltransferase